MALRSDQLAQLQQAIGYHFKAVDYLQEALTHSTYAYEHRHENLANNERLEFLGDAVLDLAISDFLFRKPEQHDEGFMTKTRALLVCENCLAMQAGRLHLGDLLLLGRGEESTGGRGKPSNLANAMEALLGAIYLDGGFEQVREIIARLFTPSLKQAVAGKIIHDYKSRLLEMVQATRGGSQVRFVILDEQGPVHAREFTAGVEVDDQLIAQGSGSSKKEAEQQAAAAAIERLECDRQECRVID